MRRLARIAAPLAALFLAAPAARAACKGRPTDPVTGGYSYAGAEVKSYAGKEVRVHWATSGTHAPSLTSTSGDGVPDTVAYAAEIGDQALSKYLEMGFRKVPSDVGCASNGGDEKVDVYLLRFTAGDGATIAECSGATCSSFVVVDSKFTSGGYADAKEGFRTVVTHELFHAVQNTYKVGDSPFWAEGTAQWAMKTLHPELGDFERQLPGFFADTTHSIDIPPTGPAAPFLYGSAVWPLFLSLRHGPDVIREIYELEGEAQDPLSAIDTVLKEKGTSLADEYPLFGAWNAGTGKLPSAGGYPNAAEYPGIKIGALGDGASGITSGLGYFVYTGVLEGPAEVALETDAVRNGGVVVPIENGTLQLERAQKLPANAEGEVLVVVSGLTTKKTDARFVLRLGPPSSESAPSAPSSSSAGAGDDGCSAAPGTSPGGGLLLGLGAVLLGTLRSRRPKR